MRRGRLAALALLILTGCGSTTAARQSSTPTPSVSASPSPSPSQSPSPTPTPTPQPPNLPRAAGIRVPAGFTAYVYATGIPTPTAMAFGPDGRLYVTSQAGLVAVVPGPGGGAQTLVSGLPIALGLVFRAQDLFVSVRGSIRSYHLSGSSLTPGPVVVSGLPVGRHQNDNIVLLPSGDFLVGNGSTCDVCVESDARSAAVLRFHADWSYVGVVVRGARNPYGLAVRGSDGEAYVTINGQDNLGLYQPADHLLRIAGGEDAGWPRCWPGYPDGRLHGSCAGVASPIAVFGPHTSADGLVFYEGGEFGQDYQDSVFATEWGANAGGPTGRRVMRVVLSGAVGAEQGTVSDFATGFSHPLGITVAPDGGLLVGDHGTGQIIEIFRTG